MSNTKMDVVPSYSVGANKRFTFLFHSTIVLQCIDSVSYIYVQCEYS